MELAQSIKEQYKQELMGKANVVAVGVGYKIVGGEKSDIPCVMVFVRTKVSAESLAPEEMVPAQIEEVPTDVVESGTIFAHQDNNARYRPAPGGVSVGHYQVTAGTFGVVVRDANTDARLMLSNNHVLANSNDATAGDPILQPGAVDGGTTADDTIARLERFQPISFQQQGGSPGTCNTAVTYAAIGNFIAAALGSDHRLYTYKTQQEDNLVDAAVARPLDGQDILDEIIEIGAVSGTAEASVGMTVRKSGRTTGLTNGEIIAVDVMTTVNYGGERNAVFDHQIMSGPMSQPGDSGSLLVEADSQNAVGLLFAGSDQTTIYNPIALVLDLLDVKI